MRRATTLLWMIILATKCYSRQTWSTTTQADVIAAVRRNFNCRCVFLLNQQEDSDFRSASTILDVQKRLAARDIQTTGMKLSKYPSSLVDDSFCRRNRPLQVFSSVNSLLKLPEHLDPSESIWLLFLDHTFALRDLFIDLDVPFDCEFLVAHRLSGDVVALTEVYRVSKTLPLQTYRWGVWSANFGLQVTSVGFYSRRNDLQGVTIKAAVITDPPHEFVFRHKDKDVEVHGVFHDKWQTITSHLNYTMRFVVPEEETYGSKVAGGSWSGMTGMVASGEADIAFYPFLMTAPRRAAVHFTIPVITTRTCVFIRTPDIVTTTWLVFLKPFSGQLWLAVGGFIVAMTAQLACLRWLVRRGGNRVADEPAWLNLSGSLFLTLGSLCMQGPGTTSRSQTYKISVLTCYVTDATLVTAYSAKLLSFLLVPRMELPFTSLEGLLQDGSYGFGVIADSGLLTNFQKTTNEVMHKIYIRFLLPHINHLPPDSLHGLKRVCGQHKYAFMDTYDNFLEYKANVSCPITILPHASFPQNVGMILNKKLPYRGIINHSLRSLRRAGVLKRLYSSEWRSKLASQKPEVHVSAVSIENLFSVNAMMGLCVALAGAVLLLEYAVGHRYKAGGPRRTVNK